MTGPNCRRTQHPCAHLSNATAVARSQRCPSTIVTAAPQPIEFDVSFASRGFPIRLGHERSAGSSPNRVVYPDGPGKDANSPAGPGPISALWADEDLVDHGYRTFAPDLEQEHLAGGGAPARERPDVHVVSDENHDLSRPEAEQELPQFGGLPVGAARVPEDRVERGQLLDRTQVEESGPCRGSGTIGW